MPVSTRPTLRLMVLASSTAAVLGAVPPADAKPYKGAEIYGTTAYRYGRMEMRMRMARGSGVLSTFFTYKGGSELSGAFWEEIDIEVFGKDDALSWQSNIITGNPRQTSEQVHAVGTSLADDYHTYVLEWTPEYVAWAVDGVEVRRTTGEQVSSLTNAQTLRFNIWASDSVDWVGAFTDSILPVYQFVNRITYSRYENGAFVLDWTDDFDSFASSRWARANWTFDGNLVDFDPANAVVQDGTLVLALTREGQTGFSGTVPGDSGGAGTGGAGGTGGAPGTGGANTGGVPETGGTSTGGVPATGGTSTGGVPATGGTSTGGVPATGGTSTGGLPSTGGLAVLGGSGGGLASGGTSPSGGATAIGGGPSVGGAATGAGGATVGSGGAGAGGPPASDSEGCSCSMPGRAGNGRGLAMLAWFLGIAFGFRTAHRRRSFSA